MLSTIKDSLGSALRRLWRTNSLEFMLYGLLLVVLLSLSSKLLVDATYIPLPDNSHYGNIPDPSDPDPSKDGVERAQDAVFSILRNVRLIMGVGTIGILVYAGIMMVVKGGDEGETTKQKSAVTYSIVGMAVIGISGAVTEILSVENGGLLNPDEAKERVVLFRVEVNLVITFIKYILGSIATLFLVISGLSLVVAGGDEGTVTSAKKRMAASALGLLLVIFSSTFIDRVFYVIDLNADETGVIPQVDTVQGIAEIVAITNIVVTLVGPVMILMLVAGGIMYIISAGDDGKMDKAKKLITNAVIGIVVIYGAFAIVSTFISGII